MKTAKLGRFEDALRHYCVKCGHISRSWSLALHKSQNVIEIRDSKSRELVYVKDYSHDDGFWGLNEPQLDVIRQSGFKWCVVLLLGSSEESFLLDSQQVEAAIASRQWSVGKRDKDYKLHKTDLPSTATRYAAFGDLFAHLLAT